MQHYYTIESEIFLSKFCHFLESLTFSKKPFETYYIWRNKIILNIEIRFLRQVKKKSCFFFSSIYLAIATEGKYGYIR